MAHANSTDPNVFILPDLGEGVHEAELIKWRVKAGDTVAEHDILAEMETDKALVEVPSPRSGTIAELHGNEGEILHVGNALVTYKGDGASPATTTKSGTPVKQAPQTAARPHDDSAPAHHNNGHDIAEPPADREDAGTVVGIMSNEPQKALATPAVRRLARDLGINIDTIKGTGIGGRVLEKDIRSAPGRPDGGGGLAPARPATSAPRPSPGRAAEPMAPSRAPAANLSAAAVRAAPGADEVTRIPFRGVRRTIANRLRESINQAVHFNVMDEADVSSLDTLRRKLGAASGEKVSFLPFVAGAVCRVLASNEFRAMNATVEEKPGDSSSDAFILQHRTVHLGIATDTDSGLMVPVIRDCDSLGVLEIGRSIAAIANAARTRTIPREQLMGSTFTISNVGSHAGRFATPIINYPEVGILAVGRARQSPVVRHGGIFIGNLLPLSLACDHRVVDGATAALALARIVELLQDPEQLLGPRARVKNYPHTGMILLIDNYDSFTWNLVQRFGELDPSLEPGRGMVVVRNDEITPEQADAMDGGRGPTHVVISPGPCSPNEAGVSSAIIERFAGRVPVLGVCLGHQCLAASNSMTVERHAIQMHGKTSPIYHDGRGVFSGLSNPFTATRYHSLVVRPETIPPPPEKGEDGWVVSAWTEDEIEGRKQRVVMGLRRVFGDAGRFPVEGVQFHPESFLTEEGPRLLKNFLEHAPTRR